MFREDGYINATQAAKQFGKDIREFLKLDSTKEYMKALEKMMGIPLNIQKQATRGRNGTTYLHPKLGIRLGGWLDVRFAVWCDLMIDNILQGNIQTSVVVPTLGNIEGVNDATEKDQRTRNANKATARASPRSPSPLQKSSHNTMTRATIA